jgi:outer membrane lipoprotein-sorting protein
MNSGYWYLFYLVIFKQRGIKMWKKMVSISLVLVMVLSFTACAKEPSAQEIIDGVFESYDNVKTYKFDLDMTMDATGEAEGESLEHNVMMNNSGTLDLENMQMQVDLSAGSGDEMISVESYIIDGMMYIRPEAPGEKSMWMKQEAPIEVWERMSASSGIENYKELLRTAQVEVIGSEKVEGVDCYVLQLNPEMAELYQTAMDPVGGIGQAGMLPPVPEELLEEMFNSFSVKQWIAKETHFLMKVEIDMTIESTPELMEYLGEEGETSLDITISFLAYNYNQPVTIELPPEAEEAI